MGNEKVKGSATPYAGYRYQSLHGVRVLVDWLNAPATLTRVRFECDDKAIGPRGLDDIIAEQPDGRMTYTQVKYTPPEAAQGCILSWDWLLDPDGQGKKPKSFVQKWAQALKRIPAALLSEAALVTNRTPDREVEACLVGEHLQFDQAPLAVQAKLVAQLGSAGEARNFLQTLKIRHSHKAFLNLEATLTERLQRMGFQDAGISRLLRRSQDWGTFKHDPPPDGWITLDTIRSTLSLAHPEPLPQDFLVPDGYEPPNLVFHEEMMERVRSSPGGVITLAGPPGRGKSTYISFLSDDLTGQQVPVVRHHYYLSLTDRSVDRLWPSRIARSLLSQIEHVTRDRLAGTVNIDKPELLAEVLEACGAAYEPDGLPFVVIIDGLDHVWRDNQGDKTPLDDLFRQLLPLPKNVVLIVGTQPVADDRLPDRFVVSSPRTDWQILPPMSGDAVYAYVMKQVRAGRWEVRTDFEQAQLARSANALRELTGGHPLHVIYSIEELLGRTRHPNEHDIRELAECPGDDIRAYYRVLWNKLSYAQRDVLHLMSALIFRWPSQAFAEMSGNTDSSRLSLDGVRHLLFETGLGLQPFHESLVVFVKEDGEHSERVAALLPRACEWLKSSAPKRLQSTWLWLVEAQLGNDQPLREGLTRDWLLDRVADGYPLATLVRMLTRAEKTAFDQRAFAEAYRHRALKMRLLNGPEDQVGEPSRLLRVSWALSPEGSLSEEAFVSWHELRTTVLPWFALALQERGSGAQARAVCGHAVDRWNSETRLRGERTTKEWRRAQLILERAILQTDSIHNSQPLAERFDGMSSWSGSILCDLLRASGSVSLIMDLWRSSRDPGKLRLLEDVAVQVAALNGADIRAWEDFAAFEHSALASILASIRGSPFRSMCWSSFPVDFDRSLDIDVRRVMLVTLVRRWFFQSVSVALYAEEKFSWLKAPEFPNREHLAGYLDALQEFAEDVADRLRRNIPVSFGEIFNTFDEIPEPPRDHYHQRWTFDDFCYAMLHVAVDLHLLCSTLGGPRHIDLASLREAENSPWFPISKLPEFALSHGQRVFARDLVRHVVEEQSQRATRELQETCTIAQQLLELCEFSLLYGEKDLARGLCRHAWDITIGYEHRKDSTLDEVLTALEYLAEADPKSTRELLRSVAAQIANVKYFTDGKGTRHIPGMASQLLARLDRASLATQYAQQVTQGEWSDAETSLRQVLTTAVEMTPELQALARTGISVEAHGEKPTKDEVFRALAAAVAEHQGVVDDRVGRKSESTGEEDDLSGNLDFEAYKPGDFKQLIQDISDRRGTQGDELSAWFQFWKDRGKMSSLVRHVRPVVLQETNRRFLLHRILDPLLDACLELEGASDDAFDVAVEAQIANGGWLPFFFESSQKSEARLRKVAQRFAPRADEFIAKSAKNWLVTGGESTELLVPGAKLVFLLVELGRVDEAVELATSMAKSVVADTSGLVLPQPAWA